MERSDLVHDALGEHIFEWFLRNKRTEWRAYKTHVSTLRDRALPEVAVSRTAPSAARDGQEPTQDELLSCSATR